MTSSIKTPWLKSPAFDLTFILLPSFVTVGIIGLLPTATIGDEAVPLWVWVVFVLGIDVSHVYSTLFRTYLNPSEVKESKTILTLIPLLVWGAGVVIYSFGAIYFWRTLAYVAVFHFIRQQYGFLRLYCRNEETNKKSFWLCSLMIYLATLYPMAYWHTHGDRNFQWFVEGDFYLGIPIFFLTFTGWLYQAVALAYLINEGWELRQGKPINLPKNLILLGTALSWYFGIVYFNGDIAFTITNVVSHGIPYMALVWIYGERQAIGSNAPLVFGRLEYKVFFSRFSVPIFFGLLFLLGFLEEGLWAGLVWREHLDFFRWFAQIPAITKQETLNWLVPLLTLPQATHYVLDGFIWKVKNNQANWYKVLFKQRALTT